MDCQIKFEGIAISIKRVSKDKIELTLPFFLTTKINLLPIGQEIKLDFKSLAQGLGSLILKK